MTHFGRAIERWEHDCKALEAQGIDPERKLANDPETYAHLRAPAPPAGFQFRDIWYDLSPMRPDEFGRQTAAKWERAEQIKRAFERGRRLEQGSRKREEEREARVQKMREQLTKGR